MRHDQVTYPKIFRQLVTLSWPIVIAFMMQTSYNIVDIFWVGKLGPTAVAAVSLAGTLFYVILALGQLLGSGTVALVAQSFGAKLFDQANEVIRQSLLVTSILALVVTISGVTFTKQILVLLGARAEVLQNGIVYLRVVFIGFFFQLLSFSINYAFRGTGDMKTPMLIMLVAALINVVLDPLLILGIGFFPRLEVLGAAIATAIAQCLSFAYGFIILIKGKSEIKLKILDTWQFQTKIIKTILAIGIPAGLSYGLMALSGMAVFRIVANFSEYALAALGIGLRILQVANLPVVGLGVATTTLIGQSLGARNVKGALQISRMSMILGATSMLLCSVVFMIYAKALMVIFTQDHNVINQGVTFLRIVALYLVFGGLTISLTGVFRGAGDTLPPMFAGLFKLLVLISLAILLSQTLKLGLNGVWWAMLISYGIEAILIGIWYMTGRWHKHGLGLLDNLKPAIISE